ncbi:hypothetical protein GJ496_007318 [Pomphorhynchus laevis]|nr:hypothetical protein GJ496_007318 [Pomphorhynchus laevis]
MGFGSSNYNATPQRFEGGRQSGGGFRGSGSGGGFRGRGRGGGGRGGGRGRDFDFGPPDTVEEAGSITHSCNGQVIVKSNLQDQVPYFNAPVYLKNKEQIGKVDEIFGPIKDYMFSVNLVDNVKAESFKQSQELYIDPRRLLPLSKFLPQPPGSSRSPGQRGGRFGGRGGGGGRGRGGGRGGSSGSGFRGRGRGGNSGSGGRFRGGGGRGGGNREFAGKFKH